MKGITLQKSAHSAHLEGLVREEEELESIASSIQSHRSEEQTHQNQVGERGREIDNLEREKKERENQVQSARSTVTHTRTSTGRSLSAKCVAEDYLYRLQGYKLFFLCSIMAMHGNLAVL